MLDPESRVIADEHWILIEGNPDSVRGQIAVCLDRDISYAKLDARRIAACLNLCRGQSIEQIEAKVRRMEVEPFISSGSRTETE